MQVHMLTGKSWSLVVVLFAVSALVLSGCGGGTPVTIQQPAPKASAAIRISPSAVLPGQSATLTWSSSYATSCTASGAWSGSQATTGSTTVILQGNTAQTYTLTCSGAGLPGESSVTLSLPPNEGQCTTAAAVRSHRLKLTRAVTAARQAVANGTSGPKERTVAP